MSLLAGVLLGGLVGVMGLAVWAIRAELRIERSEWTEEQREQLAAIAWEALMAQTKLKLDAAAAERILTGVRLQMQRGVSVYVVALDELVGQENMN